MADKKTALVILGMHRSGTSALARVLSLCGAELPKTLMEPVAGDNDKGYWESSYLAEINDRILAELGTTWDGLEPMPSDAQFAALAKQYRPLLLKALMQEFGDASLFVLKDPRLCKTLPIWLDALEAFGVSPRYIIPIRSPIEVSASLAVRGQHTVEQGLLLWLIHIVNAERFTRGSLRVYTLFNSLESDWQSCIESIQKQLNVELPIDVRAGSDEVDSFLNPNFRHHRSSESWLDDTSVSPWLTEVYQLVKALVLGDSVDLQRFDRLAQEYCSAYKLYGSLFETQQIKLKNLSAELIDVKNTQLSSQASTKEWAEQEMAEEISRSLDRQQIKLEKVVTSQIERLELKLENKNTVVMDLITKNDQLNSAIIKKNGELVDIKGCLAQERAFIESVQRENKSLVEVQTILQVANESLQLSSVQLQEREESLKGELTELHHLSDHFKVENDDFRKHCERLFQEQELLKVDLKTAQLRAAKLAKDQQELFDMEVRVNRELDELKRNGVTLREENEALIFKYQQLEDELAFKCQRFDEQTERTYFVERKLQRLKEDQSALYLFLSRPLKYWLWVVIEACSYRFRRVFRSKHKARLARKKAFLLKSGLFDKQFYIKTNPDLAALKKSPIDHYLRHGLVEGRPINDAEPSFSEDIIERCLTRVGKRSCRNIWGQELKAINSSRDYSISVIAAVDDQVIELSQPASLKDYLAALCTDFESFPPVIITELMAYVWRSRPDLKEAFNLHSEVGQTAFCQWFLVHASEEYGFGAGFFTEYFLHEMLRVEGCSKSAERLLLELDNEVNSFSDADKSLEPALENYGCNIIGYATGAFGMGQQARMMANSLHTQDMPFCILDHKDTGVHGSNDFSLDQWIETRQRYKANVFNINADVLPAVYFQYGETFFSSGYNIGCWAWELADCPVEFDLAFKMVDEVWAISEFVYDALKQRSPVPVYRMPLAVQKPLLEKSYTKSDYGLPESDFLFLFTFDAASYLERKNPMGAAEAFLEAFSGQDYAVRFAFKTMNVDPSNEYWKRFMVLVSSDERITLINEKMPRDKVNGLYDVCDVFVSLHRSEGFGLCIAEAMLFGKPVISTNYSGSLEFANSATACVVDYSLVPVADNVYPFGDGQSWAQPNVSHAASLMSKLYLEPDYRTEIAQLGKSYVEKNFSSTVIGERYASRLAQICKEQFLEPSADVFLRVQLDSPVEDVDTVGFFVEGWAVASEKITGIAVHANGVYVGAAHFGVPREDVGKVFSELPSSSRSGFSLYVDARSVSGTYCELELTVSTLSGKQSVTKKSLKINRDDAYAKWLESYMSFNQSATLGAQQARNCLLSVVIEINQLNLMAPFKRTLTSLAIQNYERLQLIVISKDQYHEQLKGLCSEFGFLELIFIADKAQLSDLHFSCNSYVACLYPSDEYVPCAFKHIAACLEQNHKPDLLYFDEDRLSDGLRVDPFFKPAWSPIYFQQFNYLGRSWFLRGDIFTEVVAQSASAVISYENNNLLTGVFASLTQVIHLPVVLFSSEDSNTSWRKQIQHDAIVTTSEPKVSIIIPSCLKDRALVKKCFDCLLEQTAYLNFEVIVVLNNVDNIEEAKAYVSGWGFQAVYWQGSGFNWAALNNFGVSVAKGDYLLFLNDDVEPLSKSWLTELVRLSTGKRVGAVGALLEYPNGSIQHAGLIFSSDNQSVNLRHVFRFLRADDLALQHLLGFDREVSAVTGACLMVERVKFDLVEGFDESFPVICNDVDFCMKLGSKGFFNLVSVRSKLIHHEGISRSGMSEEENTKHFYDKWHKTLDKGDVYYNPNLDAQLGLWNVAHHVDEFELRGR